MNSVLAWLETSALGHAMRETGPWTYGLVNLAHIIGIATLFGPVLVLDLRLLGFWRGVPLLALSDVLVSVSRAGFAIAVCAGVGMLSANATEYAGNPFLLIKFPAIGLALLNVALLMRTRAWRARVSRDLTARESRQLAVMGATSLACWTTALAAGRLIGYW